VTDPQVADPNVDLWWRTWRSKRACMCIVFAGGLP